MSDVAMSISPIRIDRRFCGPPTSGNGGYVCGRLGELFDGAAAVRLRVPPPLETELAVRRAGEALQLLEGTQLVAEARACVLSLEVPVPPPSFAEAERAAQSFRGHTEHWFPGCFVCGPERASGDGLRIFPGSIAGGPNVACPWVPDETLAGPDGTVAPEFLWAALDCPGAFAFPPPASGGVLLGELAVNLTGSVLAGEPCVLLAWQLSHQGRKHTTGTALFGQDGGLRGVGRAIWIEVST